LKKILIIANPKAGKGKAVHNLAFIQMHLEKIGFISQVYFTQNTNDQTGISEVVNTYPNIDGLLILGGDGTLNDVVNALPVDYIIPLLILPCGSGNDFSSYLYPKKSIEDILNLLIKRKTTAIDMAECNGKKFINGLGIGFDGWVAKKANEGASWIPVFLKYNLAILRGLFTYKSFYTSLGQNLIIAVANGPTYGGGFKIAPEANPTDGFLDLWQIKPIPSYKRPYYLELIKKGKHQNKKGPYQHELVKEIEIICYKKLPAHLDGEYFESDRFKVNLTGHKLIFISI
jgi:diacylglycerol kinase (ATP)